jgi:heme exporter protein A
MLRVKNLQLWRGDRHILRGLAFEVAAGELLHVAGPNGTGKTTLLRVVCGLAQPEEGDVSWRGVSIRTMGTDYFADLSYVAHDAGLKGDLTARENLAFVAGLRFAVSPAQIDSALATLIGLGCGDLPVGALSAGQRRRVALARLVLSQATVWILDEPLTNLDTAGASLVLELLAGHVQNGGLALVAAHSDLSLRGSRVRRLELS